MLETVKIILNLLPLVIQVVQQLEALFPEGCRGKMKFELVVKSIQSVYDVSDKTLPIIEKMIDVVVSILNQFGVFKKA